MTLGPKLLVAWEPRWEGFVSAIRPALSRSAPRLSAECDAGLNAGRMTFASFLLHAAIVFVMIAVSAQSLRMRGYERVDPYDAFEPSEYHIIYYRGQELPEMKDAGGAESGASGLSGGRELYSPTQVIRIVRGNKLVETVVDSPSLKLPHTNEAVANVLSLPAGPAAAPPMTGLRSLMASANLAPAVTPVPAAPAVVHERLNAPQMNASVAAPAPNVARDRLNLPQMDQGVAAPAPNVSRDKLAIPAMVQNVAAPAPDAKRQIAGMRLPDTGSLQPVEAPITAAPRDIGHTPKFSLPASGVVGPSPSASLPVGNRNVDGPMIASVQVVEVVPPAPQVGGGGGGRPGGGGTGGANGDSGAGMIGSALKALNSVIGTLGASGPGAGGSGNSPGGGGIGLIASAHPGSVVGVPGNGEPGAIAMSPNGGNELGMGGSGGGSGIGHGTGPGSGTQGNGPGAANSGSGLGVGGVRPGTTLGPGPGGSGSGAGSPGGIQGVSIHGGKVTLPSFGTASSTPGIPTRGPNDKRNPPAITIIATSRSGGAVDLYGALKGTKVYTIYIDTQIGMAVLQYAERAQSAGEFSADLTAPEVMNSDVPSDIPRSRVLLACVMDKTGALKNVRVLDSVKAEVTQRVIAAISRWRFRPVLRGDEPVDVDAIVGFNIDTADHR